MRRKPREKRKKSEKRPGGQKGHQGQTLVQNETPDRVIQHRPLTCENCQHDLQDVAGETKERQQIHDLPELRLEVEEHQAVEVCCPRCYARRIRQFPPQVRAAAQYGPRVRALTIYLSQFQLLPMERVCETLDDLCHCRLSRSDVGDVD